MHILSNVEEVKGKKGTAAIFDTNITHKAGQVLGINKRLAIRIDKRLIPYNEKLNNSIKKNII